MKAQRIPHSLSNTCTFHTVLEEALNQGPVSMPEAATLSMMVNPKFLDSRKICYKLPKIQTKRPNHRRFCPKDANGIANSEDPDQTGPLGAVWSGSALFDQTYLSEN